MACSETRAEEEDQQVIYNSGPDWWRLDQGSSREGGAGWMCQNVVAANT